MNEEGTDRWLEQFGERGKLVGLARLAVLEIQPIPRERGFRLLIAYQ